MSSVRVLTGITTSGVPHLGNYAGAIRPCIQASQQSHVDSYLFMADYHALIKCGDPERVAKARLQIAATWLAAGLNPDRVTFYCQSDIPEIPELNWLLNCVTPKGLMNRAHAYKASVDQNLQKGEEADDGVTMGLYCYPILMAADILMFNAHKVPVGRDQIQHLEMARDIAQRFNHLYGDEYFVLPEVQIEEDVAILPGLDGRKMSKSYDNTIPLFEGGAVALKSAVARIQTDSRLPGEPKDADNSHLFTLYRAFATPEQSAAFRQELLDGLAWGEAKNRFYHLLEETLAPMRERYDALMARPDDITDILLQGAKKARQQATPFMARLREAVGLRLMSSTSASKTKSLLSKSKKPRFVSFKDGEVFRFRLLSAQGDEVLLSEAFDNPRDAGLWMKRLQQAEAVIRIEQSVLFCDEHQVGVLHVSSDVFQSVLDELKAA